MPGAQLPADHLRSVQERIAEACRRAGRDPDAVALLAVSKTHPASAVRALADAGVRCFGENYVDEAADKQDELADDRIVWHFIGPVQSNKTRALSERFDWIQSVDRPKIVRRLADQRPEGRARLNVLLQVNIDRETQKSGCDPDAVPALADAVAQRRELRLRGVMAIPAAGGSERETRAAFARLRALYERVQGAHAGVDTLSMGMSGDLEAAVAEGSTMVRIGTALFGPREA